MQFNNVRFIGQLSFENLDSNGEFRKKFLDEFKLFMKSKDDVVLFSVNEYNYDDEKLQCSIKGECLSYLESKIDERLLNSYIHEFRIQFDYDLKMYRLYNDKEGTELIPANPDKRTEIRQKKEEYKKEEVKEEPKEEIKEKPKKEVVIEAKEEIHKGPVENVEPEREEAATIVEESIQSKLEVKEQEGGKVIENTIKPAQKVVTAQSAPKVTEVPKANSPMKPSVKESPYLYHYTDLSSLAMILKTKSIKFSNLKYGSKDRFDLKNNIYDKFCFISSWTKEKTERIEMWKNYCGDLKGVRIKLPVDPFKMYLYDGGSVKMQSNIDISNYFKDIKNYQMSSVKNVQAMDITYVRGASNMFGHLTTMDKNTFMEYSNKIGLYKDDIYEHEKESVYRMFIYPWRLEESKKVMSSSDEILKRFNEVVLPFDEKYLEIDENKFKDMEIVLGPECSEGEKVIVEVLVSQYNPLAVIRESALKR